MKPVVAVFALLVGAAGFCGGARGEASDFIGNWKNPDSKASGLMHVAISPNGGNRVDVRAYGDCHPMECDWGIVQGDVYYDNPKSDHVSVIVATFHFGLAHRQITFHKGPDGKLFFEMLVKLDDNSGRHDFSTVGYLKPTTWVGPVGPVWQSEPGLQTGWGGGARSGAVRLPPEDCTAVDTQGLHAVNERGVWQLKAGGKTLIATGKDDKAARLAETAFHHYRFDRICRTGGQWKPYWRSADGFGREKLAGIYCLTFNPNTAHLVRLKNAWTIVDGAATLVDLGPFKDQAEAMLAMIRVNKLTGECFIGSPDIMTFWVAEPVR
jgi:hypothetical protein